MPSFILLNQNTTPIQKNYFGVRHGKSSCDACTGRVKQGVTALVKSGQAVVDSAWTFYSTCVEHDITYLVKREIQNLRSHEMLLGGINIGGLM